MKQRVLLWQNVGFLAVIAVSWCTEFFNFHSLLVAEHPLLTRFQDFAVDMLLILAIWFLVLRTTGRLLAQIRQVEGMMHVCGWCSRVRRDSGWVAVDQFFLHELHTRTSHGICEDCCRSQERALHQLSSASAAGKGARRQPSRDSSSMAMAATSGAKSV